ncbi:uncharacterized protein LOC117174481 [Belonocnema kinseyi]|uniref:uncharacterized protein LOC117174481 n=1 Tax=Belonocnema kinseyi TaxID=2817044 RepID=UPI00143D7E24|nr:uncharacterized protein LOC117174481 [Belonocnema kinseyi]
MESPEDPIRHLYEYVDLIEKIKEKRPGFFPALFEMHRSIVKDLPTDSELLKKIIEKFDLVPRAPTANLRTTGTQTYFKVQKPRKTIATQTSIKELKTLATQTSSLLLASKTIAAQTPSPPTTHNLIPSASTTKSSTISPSTALVPPESKPRICSLLSLNIPTPRNINPYTLQFLHSTARYACWNCQEPTHKYPQCQRPLTVFCFKCGEPGFSSLNCPYCARSSSSSSSHRNM